MHNPLVEALGVAPGSICHHLQVLHGPHDSDDDSAHRNFLAPVRSQVIAGGEGRREVAARVAIAMANIATPVIPNDCHHGSWTNSCRNMMIAAIKHSAPTIISTPVATNAKMRSISSSRAPLHIGAKEPELGVHNARHVIDDAREQAGPIGMRAPRCGCAHWPASVDSQPSRSPCGFASPFQIT